MTKHLKSLRNLALIMALLCVYSISFAQVAEGEDEDVNQYGVTVSSFPLKATAQNNILVLGNKEKGYKFWMDNRVQFDGAHYFNLKNGMLDANGEPYMVGGVSMRRVRLAAKAQVTKNWYGEVDVNFANGVFELEDAYVMYSGLKGFEFKAGNFKEDFSMDQTTTSRYSTFMERPMVVQMFAPSRHIGIQAQWIGVDWFRISFGASWQLIDNADTRLNVEEFNKQGKGMGTNFTGKVVWMPKDFLGIDRLHIGYNGSYRHAKKTDDNVDGATALGRGYEGNYFSTRNSTAISRLKFISVEYYGVKYDYLHGAEFAGYKDGFRFQSECIMNHSVMDPEHPRLSKHKLAKETKFFWGYYLQASYMLFGGKQRYDVTQSEFTQPTRGRSWGDIEVMARWDYVNLNSQELYGGAGQNLALGMVYHVNNNVKIMLNYQWAKNDKYAGNKGKAVIGRDADGNYTAATSGPNAAVSDFGVRFNTIQARIEIDF